MTEAPTVSRGRSLGCFRFCEAVRYGLTGARMSLRMRGRIRSKGRRSANRSTTVESHVGAPLCARCGEVETRCFGLATYAKWCAECYKAICLVLGRRP